ncbi:winged helix-turn-helix transcriptional regulator [Rhodovibrionaceae bacterium A322]
MKFPTPGKPVRGSRSGAPIMALFDLLGRRWAMGIVWTLAEAGPCTFRELQDKTGDISPASLNTRLKELRGAGLIHHSGDGYEVTGQGRELYDLLVPLGNWSKDWAQKVEKDSAPSR